MAKQQKSKGNTGGNPHRPNGKAWKKPKQAPKKVTNPTQERVERRAEVWEARLRRKEANKARRRAEQEALEALVAEEQRQLLIEQDRVYVPERIKQIAAA